MRKKSNRIVAALLTAVFLIITMSTAAYADDNLDGKVQLEDGTVAGLPEKLVVLDDSGKSVSENGDYYFEVEDMENGKTYVKNIQIMNLREGKAYHIYFSADPIAKYGDIDLENECECIAYLEDQIIYKGKVTGEGDPDIRNDNALDLGVYSAGQGRTLRIEITWHWNGSGTGAIDDGYRIVDKDGIKVIRPKEGKDHAEGEIIFKWKFTAKETTDTSHPDTPVDTGETITFIFAGVVAVAIVVMFILVVLKQKKKKEEET